MTGRKARSSSDEALDAGACSGIRSRAFGVADPLGLLPGRYGRNVIAGSVSRGMSTFRSCSKLIRLRLTPLSACCRSASLKSSPATFSVHSSVSLPIGCSDCCRAAALCGLLDHFLTESNYYYFSFAMGVLGMLLHFPKKGHVRAATA